MMTRMAVSKVIDVWHKFRSDVAPDAPDVELLRRFAATRDEAAFDCLVRRHGPMVWGVCQRLLNQRQDAEDAFQTTFLVLARKASAVGRRELLANWLFGVARRSALTLRRSRARRAVHEFVCGEVPDVRHSSPEHWSEVAGVLDEEIARLPDKYRRPLLLCGLEGLTHAAAAETLDWPVGTVAGRLSRARDLLRTRLRKRGVEVSAATLTAVLASDTYAVVPPALVATTVSNGVVFAATGATTTFSGPVALATGSLLQQMAMTRVISYVVLLGAIMCVVGIGVGLNLEAEAGKETTLAPAGKILGPSPDAPVQRPSGRFIALPEDPSAVILALDRIDHRPDRTSSHVTIHAGGLVIGTVTEARLGAAPTTEAYQSQLSPEELQDLMQFVVHDQEFFEFDRERLLSALQAEYALEGTPMSSQDAGTTTIRVRTADHEHVVRWDQLGTSEIYFREVRRIRQLVFVDRKLKNLLSVMRAGGKARAGEIAEQVNGHLNGFLPREKALTAADLTFVGPAADGNGVRYVFTRGYKYGGAEFFNADYVITADGKGRLTGTTPVPSQTAPSLPRRTDIAPRCFEDDLDS